LLLLGCRGKPGGSIEGSYATVSESEWNDILILKKGGVAEIQAESWEAGEYESRSSVKTEGRWRLEGNFIILEYAGITDRLRYDPKLSVAILGYKGGAPGLQQTGTFAEGSILRDQPLWKLPHRFGETSEPR
jgi:hypothetical protein